MYQKQSYSEHPKMNRYASQLEKKEGKHGLQSLHQIRQNSGQNY